MPRSDVSRTAISVTFDPEGNALGLGDKTGSMPPSQAKRHTVRTYVDADDAVDRVTAALWESLPIGCSEHELQMIVARGIAGSRHD